jgi:hypothetical protein
VVFELTNGTVEEEDRSGWTIACLSCGQYFAYTILNLNMSPEPVVYLYCDACSNFVLWEDEDRRELLTSLAHEEGEEFDAHASKLAEDLRKGELYDRLQRDLPPCGCGGHFGLWNNVKCPHCQYEFPYNAGYRYKAFRFGEREVIWVEGAIAYRGSLLPGSKLAKVIV